MIYIFSQKDDISTNDILAWLRFYKQPFLRINGDDQDAHQAVFDHLSTAGLRLSNEDSKTIQDEPAVFWFRRPGGNVADRLASKSFPEQSIEFPTFKSASRLLQSMHHNYAMYLRTYFHLHLNQDGNRLGSYFKTTLNKLEVLDLAQGLGLHIPASLVTNDMQLLSEFYEAHDRDIICKTLYEIIYPVGVEEEGFTIRCLTAVVEKLADLPKQFFPTLFQQNIRKKYELRVFYLKGKCYTAALFSQSNSQTETDFRNSDRNNPTRIVPYQLDEQLESQLDALMKAVGLNTGSIDLIKGIDNNYYFLEINPVGQFGFVSAPCNYGLDALIANELKTMHEAL